MSEDPFWLNEKVALAVHDRQLAEHGGGVGTRDAGALASALARPVNKFAYGEEDRCALAAAYAFGIARNHPFVDGNKRTAWVMARLFLARNGVMLGFRPEEAVAVMLGLAAGEVTEDQFSQWLRDRVAQPQTLTRTAVRSSRR